MIRPLHKITHGRDERARAYAAANKSDPFAYSRAISRLRTFGDAGILEDDSGHLVID